MGAFLVVASIGAITIFLGSCSTIVKGTQQQVSVNTPGVPGAMCTLQSPAIGSRAVQTPSNVVLPKSKHNVAVACTAQCYAPGVATLASHTEIMTAGNVVFGGVIGLGVDAASGAMNVYDSSVDVIMTPIPACGGVPGKPKKARGTPVASAY
jgi:hypothetical protein